jgi:hypothetical protein
LQRVGAGFKRERLADTPFAISTFGEGEDGSVFVANRALGNVFKIAPTVTVLFPAGGEVIPAGSQQTISWDAAPDISTFNVNFRLITGHMDYGRPEGNWKEPSLNVPPQAASSTCLVRVIGFDAAGVRVDKDRSDNTFTISPP